jgi:serine protease Do
MVPLHKNNQQQHIITLFFIFFLLLNIFFSGTCLSQENNADPIPTLLKTANAFTSIIKRAKPAVVNILVKKESPKSQNSHSAQQNFFEDQLIKDFFGSSPEQIKSKKNTNQNSRYGNGSGFIISQDGYIITNHHVVKDAIEVSVYLQDKREYSAKIIGTDSQSDIALLKINAIGLPVLLLGDSNKLQVGEWAIAIGSPLEFIQTVTVGIISAKGRSSMGISEYEDFIQTDAAINPGNSGGPLLNIYGEAIGINTAFMTQTGGYMGVGFAVPSNMAKIIILQLKKHNKMLRGWLGVGLVDIIPGNLSALESRHYRGAAKVVSVKRDSPADNANIKMNDMIVALNESPISGASDFRNQIALTPPGNNITLTFLRNGKTKNAQIRIGTLD